MKPYLATIKKKLLRNNLNLVLLIVLYKKVLTFSDCVWNYNADHLKELCHNILSHFFDGLNCSLSAGKPNNNGLLRKKNTKGLMLKQKGPEMAEDEEYWSELEMTILKSLAIFFFQNTRMMT